MKSLPFLSLTPLLFFSPILAQERTDSLSFRMETAVVVSNGDDAPLWLTANRYGMGSNAARSAYLRAGAAWQKEMKKN